ncbi:hypothetical protein GJ744_011862 [Endocarpon pusillum]|uniref:Uncharacterized protein n=1 Tax=Endocarpon pusillum TaxID=364733 RepID=A0A8H7E0P6_9EURO|nr:hypothetical protein GJ744_011862 [Endocarpon pusillum]
MEYQDYELQGYEGLKKKLEETQEKVASRRKVLVEAGISAFEGIQELGFATYCGLAMEWGGEEVKAEKKEKLAERKLRLAERKLRLAEKRLKTAESDNLGEMVERELWVGLFLKELESAQIRLNEVQPLAEDAKRILDPHTAWVRAKMDELAKRRDEDIEEAETAELESRIKEQHRLLSKASEARKTHDRAKEEMQFAEEGHKAARSDNFGEIVERAALIKVIQEEVRSAETQFEEAKASAEKTNIKAYLMCGLNTVSVSKEKIKRHDVLLKWIEQQRREIVSGCTDVKNEGGQRSSKRAGLRALRNHFATEASKPNKLLKANGRQQKRSTARSVLSPVDPTKVSKAPRSHRSPYQKMSGLCNGSQAAETASSNSNTPKPRRKQEFKAKDAMPPSLRPIHSSRVSKPGDKRPARRGRNGTKLPPTTGTHRTIRKDDLGTSSTPSAGRKVRQHSAKVSPRRSTRISKQPGRFRPA